MTEDENKDNEDVVEEKEEVVEVKTEMWTMDDLVALTDEVQQGELDLGLFPIEPLKMKKWLIIPKSVVTEY